MCRLRGESNGVRDGDHASLLTAVVGKPKQTFIKRPVSLLIEAKAIGHNVDAVSGPRGDVRGIIRSVGAQGSTNAGLVWCRKLARFELVAY